MYEILITAKFRDAGYVITNKKNKSHHLHLNNVNISFAYNPNKNLNKILLEIKAILQRQKKTFTFSLTKSH